MRVKDDNRRARFSTNFFYIYQVFLVTLLLCHFFTFGQTSKLSGANTISIKGIIIDSVSKAALAHVSVEIQELGKGHGFKSTLSGENGFFKLTGLQRKEYQFVLTYVGYKAKTITIPAFTSAAINLGTIELSPIVTKLKEVQVVSQKPIIEQDVDKISYNVDADPESKTATAFEILRKVPLLTADVEDNLQLNGNDNYRVLINGKSSSLFLRNPSDAFKSLSAVAIKTIEVITVPSSKYEAQGVGGIINIITYKKSIGGYNGGINIQTSRPQGFSTNGNIAATQDKITFSGNFSYNSNVSPVNSSIFSRQDKIRHTSLEQVGENKSNNESLNFGSEVSFEPNSNNQITAIYNQNTGNNVNDFTQKVVLLNAAYEPEEQYRRLNIGNNKQYGKDFSINYQHSFKRKETHQLTLLYNWSNGNNRSIYDFALQPLVNFKRQVSTANSKDEFQEKTFQADYIHPIGKHILELGASSVLRKNSSDYFYKDQDTLTGAFLLDSSQSNIFHYSEDIYAAYTSLSLKLGEWGLKLGARLEQAKINARFISSSTSTEQNYFNPIPNVSLSRKLKGISTIKLSYTQRMNRPGLDYLNPYVDLTDPWNISYGNPGLRPALTHLINLAYSTSINKTFLNINFVHQFANNTIQQFTVLGADTVSRTTFGNIGQNKNYNLTISGNTTVLKKLSLNFNGNANYLQYTSTINGKPHTNEGLTYSASGSANLRLKRVGVASNINYNAPNIMAQGKTSGYISNSITVNRYFLKNNKANITLSIVNPFVKRRNTFSEINDPSFYMLRESYFVIRRYSLSVNYRFAKLEGTNSSKK